MDTGFFSARFGACRRSAGAPVLAAVSMLISAMPGTVQAQPMSAPRFYVQAGGGWAYQTSGRYDRDDRDDGGGAAAFKVGAGVQITPRWGVELGYYNLGRIGIQNRTYRVDYETWVASLTGTGTIAFTPSFSLVGRAGLGYLNSDISVPSSGYKSSTDKVPLVLGIGVRYALAPQLDLTADYDYLGQFGGYQTRHDVGVGMLSVGLRFRF